MDQMIPSPLLKQFCDSRSTFMSKNSHEKHEQEMKESDCFQQDFMRNQTDRQDQKTYNRAKYDLLKTTKIRGKNWTLIWPITKDAEFKSSNFYKSLNDSELQKLEWCIKVQEELD